MIIFFLKNTHWKKKKNTHCYFLKGVWDVLLMNRFGFYLSYFTLILHVYFAEYQILDWHFPAFNTSKVCIHCLLFEICCFQVEIQLWGVWLQVWMFSCWQLLNSLLHLFLLPHNWTSWWKSLDAPFFPAGGRIYPQKSLPARGNPHHGPTSQS